MNNRAEDWEDDTLKYRTFLKGARFSSREEGKKTFFEKFKDRFLKGGNHEKLS